MSNTRSKLWSHKKHPVYRKSHSEKNVPKKTSIRFLSRQMVQWPQKSYFSITMLYIGDTDFWNFEFQAFLGSPRAEFWRFFRNPQKFSLQQPPIPKKSLKIKISQICLSALFNLIIPRFRVKWSEVKRDHYIKLPKLMLKCFIFRFFWPVLPNQNRLL